MPLKKKVEPKKTRKTRVLSPGMTDGRPPIECTEELTLEICHAIATNSHSIKTLCKNNPHWPSHDTIWRWIGEDKKFSDHYAMAKRRQAELLVDDLLDTAKESTDKNAVARNRLIIDTSKWLACKLIPKVYGDRVTLEDAKTDNDEMRKELLKLREELAAKNKKDY